MAPADRDDVAGVRLFRSEVRGQGLFRRSRAAGTPARRAAGRQLYASPASPAAPVSPVTSPGPVPGRRRAGATTTMEHCRGHNHHDAPSSWFSGPACRHRNAIRCITGTTRPAIPMLTSEKPHPCGVGAALAATSLGRWYLASHSSPAAQLSRVETGPGRMRPGYDRRDVEVYRLSPVHLHIVPGCCGSAAVAPVVGGTVGAGGPGWGRARGQAAAGATGRARGRAGAGRGAWAASMGLGRGPRGGEGLGRGWAAAGPRGGQRWAGPGA